MTVPQLREYQANIKAEKRTARLSLKAKEREERLKFEQWKVEQKYKRKRKQAKSRKKSGGLLEMLGGTTQRSSNDPLGLFGSPKKTTRKRKRRKK